MVGQGEDQGSHQPPAQQGQACDGGQGREEPDQLHPAGQAHAGGGHRQHHHSLAEQGHGGQPGGDQDQGATPPAPSRGGGFRLHGRPAPAGLQVLLHPAAGSIGQAQHGQAQRARRQHRPHQGDPDLGGELHPEEDRGHHQGGQGQPPGHDPGSQAEEGLAHGPTPGLAPGGTGGRHGQAAPGPAHRHRGQGHQDQQGRPQVQGSQDSPGLARDHLRQDPGDPEHQGGRHGQLEVQGQAGHLQPPRGELLAGQPALDHGLQGAALALLGQGRAGPGRGPQPAEPPDHGHAQPEGRGGQLPGNRGQPPGGLGLHHRRGQPGQEEARQAQGKGGRGPHGLPGHDRVVAPGLHPAVAARRGGAAEALELRGMPHAPEGQAPAHQAHPQGGPHQGQGKGPGQARSLPHRQHGADHQPRGRNHHHQAHPGRGQPPALAAAREEHRGLGGIGAHREEAPHQDQPGHHRQGRRGDAMHGSQGEDVGGPGQGSPQEEDQGHRQGHPVQGPQAEAGQGVHEGTGLQAGAQDLFQAAPAPQGDQDPHVQAEVVPGQARQQAQGGAAEVVPGRGPLAHQGQEPRGQAEEAQGQEEPEGRGPQARPLAAGLEQGSQGAGLGLARREGVRRPRGSPQEAPRRPFQGQVPAQRPGQAVGSRQQPVQPGGHPAAQAAGPEVPGPLGPVLHQLAGARREARGDLGDRHRRGGRGQAPQDLLDLPTIRATLQVGLDPADLLRGGLAVDPRREGLEELVAGVFQDGSVHRDPSRPFPVRAWTKRCRALARRLRTVPRGIWSPSAISS